jgi:hypothetical protein
MGRVDEHEVPEIGRRSFGRNRRCPCRGGGLSPIVAGRTGDHRVHSAPPSGVPRSGRGTSPWPGPANVLREQRSGASCLACATEPRVKLLVPWLPHFLVGPFEMIQWTPLHRRERECESAHGYQLWREAAGFGVDLATPQLSPFFTSINLHLRCDNFSFPCPT